MAHFLFFCKYYWDVLLLPSVSLSSSPDLIENRLIEMKYWDFHLNDAVTLCSKRIG